MSRKWLFRLRLSETSNNKEKARGAGHLMKCLSVARTARKKGETVKFSVNEVNESTRTFLQKRNIPFSEDSDPVGSVSDVNPDIVISDVNYMDESIMQEMKRICPTVNLAPRGRCKYYADLSFNSAHIEDVPIPDDATLDKWYAGPEYAILNPDFVSYRRQSTEEELLQHKSGLIIQMGGVDQYNLTQSMVAKLNFNRISPEQVTVVVGPYNQSSKEIIKQCEDIENCEVYIDPDDYCALIAKHQLALLATGISTYEALSVGTPSVNVGLTEFHRMRGRRLEDQEVIHYLGKYQDVQGARLTSVVQSLLDDKKKVKKMRRRGIDLIDGRGPERITKKVGKELLETPL